MCVLCVCDTELDPFGHPPEGENFSPFTTVGRCQERFNILKSRFQYKGSSFGSIFLSVVQLRGHLRRTPPDGRRQETVMFSLASDPEKARRASRTSSLRLSRSFPIHSLFPGLIHAVTPFNRGQAVKDPITEVKHTFHVLPPRT